MTPRDPVVIVGAGPAGMVLAMFVARREVPLLVLERDGEPVPADRSDRASSINLTLCPRGLAALDALGVTAAVTASTVPLYGRRLHLPDGKSVHHRYGPHGEALYALTRANLTRTLRAAATDRFGVSVGFGQRCVATDPERPAVQVEDRATGVRRWVAASAVVGADGAFSAVRRSLQAQGRVAASVERATLTYRQVTLSDERGWHGETDALHVWPRGDEMMLAIPNDDGSVTAGLLVEAAKTTAHGALSHETGVLRYFRDLYPGTGLDAPARAREFLDRRAVPLTTVRCRPWNAGRVLLVGDAAHGMLPSYGQGANAAFQDALVLDECIAAAGDDWAAAFARFDTVRHPDTDVMADLSLQHLVDLRSSMADPTWRVRAKVEAVLSRVSVNRYSPLYERIAFTTVPYTEAIAQARRWSPLIDRLLAIDTVRDRPASIEAEAAVLAVLTQLEPGNGGDR